MANPCDYQWQHGLSGTVNTGAAANGPYLTTITATDGSATAQLTFHWNISSAVTVATPGDHTPFFAFVPITQANMNTYITKTNRPLIF